MPRSSFTSDRHGSLATKESNDKEQLPVLAREHSVYVVDLPGQGYTQLHDRNFRWNLAAMTGAIGTFMDAVGVPRAALAGNSWSGGWALAFAQRHPERISRLALLDARVRIVDGCRHAPQLDCPEQVNPLLADFLRDGRGQ